VELGTPGWVVVKRGSPHAGTVEIPIGQPAVQTPDCLTNMDRWIGMRGDDWEPLDVLDGRIELGP
jgi:hypothetical protein